ncbi:hypothetical protein HNO88_004502 [Novosphingobium chloroacetimidivorans]|uniref:Uncharacterized protein n=1 Tax=Novosphingobium chloroacetimidivorans TaxID=1428314 RepID=A0A7W7KF99_9SPHN|nr:hypothetical protein [Novosphingobium chloroacetimidivorans]
MRTVSPTRLSIGNDVTIVQAQSSRFRQALKWFIGAIVTVCETAVRYQYDAP